MELLAQFYLWGSGTDQNLIEGKKWLLRAAKAGSIVAKESIAWNCARIPELFIECAQEVFQWAKELERREHRYGDIFKLRLSTIEDARINAISALRTMYMYGIGTEQDMRQAVNLARTNPSYDGDRFLDGLEAGSP